MMTTYKFLNCAGEPIENVEFTDKEEALKYAEKTLFTMYEMYDNETIKKEAEEWGWE